MARILIIGGYGAFGARVARRLAREADLEIVVAGRNAGRAEQQAMRLEPVARAVVRHAVIDARGGGVAELRRLAPLVVINASGPFRDGDYALAAACIGAGSHYVDLADDRKFVMGIGALDGAAKAGGVLVASGASSVPGLSSAVVAAYAHEFREIRSVDIGISPGNSFDPGAATVASVLSGLGMAISTRSAGAKSTVYAWQGARRHEFPGIGRRWMGHVDVPDLDLLPAHHPSLQTVRFQAGLEVPLFHLALWSLSWLVRAGLVRRPERLARALLAIKRRLSFLGSDCGGMFVTIAGLGRDGREICLNWHLIARSGDGAFIPAIPCTVLAKRLARGLETMTGAVPCFGLMTLEAFTAEVADLDVTLSAAFADASPEAGRGRIHAR